MYQILLDSSNEYLSVGLAKEGVLIEGVSYKAWQRQSELMVKELDELLNKHNVDKKNISEVVTAIGPGSYTGVRISLTITKTLCYVTKAKMYAVSSLFLQKDRKNPTICIMNARSNRSYFAVYNNDVCEVKDQVLDNESVIEFINSHPTYVVSGDAKHLGIESSKPDFIGGLLDSIKEENLVDNIFSLKPVYLKDVK